MGHNRWREGIAPVVEVAPGEEIEIQTHDAFDGQIPVRLNRVHALTGPVYVVGAAPADPSIVPRNAGIAAETMRQAPGRRPYFPVATLLWAGRKCSYRGRKMQLSHFRSACLGPIILSAGPREAPKPRSRPPSIGFSPPGQTGWPGGPAWTALFIGGKNLKNPGGGARSRHRYNDSRWSRT